MTPTADALVAISIPIAIVLLLAYVASDVVLAPPARGDARRERRRGGGLVVEDRARHPRRRDGHHSARGRDPRRHAGGLVPPGRPVGVLRLGGDRRDRRQRSPSTAAPCWWSPTRGKIRLAAEIALASSAQVAVFLIPAVTLLALLINPFALSFRPIELAALAFSTVVTSILLADGRSSRLKGTILIVAYVAVATAFYIPATGPRKRRGAVVRRRSGGSARALLRGLVHRLRGHRWQQRKLPCCAE